MSDRSPVPLLAAAGVALVLGVVVLPALGPIAALAGAAFVIAGAAARRFWLALLPLGLAICVAAYVIGDAPPPGEEDWRGLLVFAAFLAGAGAASCLTVGTAVARLAAKLDWS